MDGGAVKDIAPGNIDPASGDNSKYANGGHYGRLTKA
jgi:hypothetical protein